MNVKIIFGIVVLFTIFTFTANAAAPVSGKILEESTGHSLEYANILLLSLPDSSFVTGATSSEDGQFRFDNVSSGKYLLKISYIGLENQLLPVDVSTKPVDLGDIVLKESNTLREVVVTSKIPPFQSGINGGIVANVSTTLLSTVGTATDVLQRMPGILANNNQITVFGKGAPLMYINNRKVQDLSELERLESSEISTVELITNPGAKYDAEGRAVLLIKTKTRVNGFSIQATERIRIGKYLGDNENISIAYTKEPLNLFATYYHNYTKQEADENHRFLLKNTNDLWQHDVFIPNYRYSRSTQQASAGLDYSLNDKHAIGGQYQFDTQKNENINTISSLTHLNNVKYDESHVQSFLKATPNRHLMNAFYSGKLNDKFSLRVDFDYLKNHEYREQRSDETATLESRTVNTFSQTDYDLYAGKWTNSYQSNAGLIEFGGEYNYIAGNGFTHNPEGYTDNNEFTNKEQKAAGFVGYSHRLNDINVSVGLRYEFTSEQFTDSTGTIIINQRYSDWYPNLSVSKKIKNMDLSLALNKRTQRPRFSELNGNTLYVNRFLFQKGNPYLKKANIYDLNLQATMNPFYLNIGYIYEQNPIVPFFQEQEKNKSAILSTYDNFPNYQELNATLNFNYKMRFWQPNYTAAISQPFFSANYDGQKVSYNRPYCFFVAYNDFTLPLSFVLSCNFRYSSKARQYYIEGEERKQFDLGLRKSFFNNALRANLTVYDIFNWTREQAHIQFNNLRWDTDKKFETRYATLSITWMFNNYKKKYRGGSAAQDDINRF
ncbi:MAG: outer membrane beta-barrel protein [Dysgonamonadaceae bacterium]|nr:outer membrane beta-barrel protein [Dysgonamonadaceae bacterium]